MKPLKKLSIKDVAKALDVSTTTVSFVLNGRAKEKRISVAIEEKVEKFVKEANYYPNPFAVGLRTGKSNVIGLLVEDSSDFFSKQIINAIIKEAGSHGYDVICRVISECTANPKRILEELKERRLDGYIIVYADNLIADLKVLDYGNVPFVFFDVESTETFGVDFIGVDHKTAMTHAVEFLISRGYNAPALITTDTLQHHMKQRLEGYETACINLGVRDNIKEVSYSLSDEEKYMQIYSFLNRKRKIDAVIFTNSLLTLWGLKAIRDLKLEISEDIGVISYEDNEWLSALAPSITAISSSVQSIASGLVNNLVIRANKQFVVTTIPNMLISPVLNIRDSTPFR